MYNYALSLEENLAFEIYQVINRYNSKLKGYNSFHFDNSVLDNLIFEISNKEDIRGKNLLFSYVLKEGVNIKSIELHLMTIGIKREFTDKSNHDENRYLVIRTMN